MEIPSFLYDNQWHVLPCKSNYTTTIMDFFWEIIVIETWKPWDWGSGRSNQSAGRMCK